MREPVEKLCAGLQQLGVTTDGHTRQQLMQYLELMLHWNETVNLTSIRDIHTMVDKHLLDSLAILPLLEGRRVLDVGTGAGLPGIPLALVDKQRHYTLLDSRGKRIRFLFDIKTRLQIPNVDLVESRIEQYTPETGFDVVVSRAFSSLGDFTRLAGHTMADNGMMLAMKGQVREEELSEVVKPYIVTAVHSLPSFGEAGHRHAIGICRQPEPLAPAYPGKEKPGNRKAP